MRLQCLNSAMLHLYDRKSLYWCWWEEEEEDDVCDH